jgi:hypothetical protein
VITREQRDRHALCGARRKNGEKCRKFAGEGTDHRGYGRCKLHLGRTKNHNQHAAKLEAQQRMIKMGAPIAVRPAEALMGMLHLSAGHCSWLREEVAALQDLGTAEAQTLVNLYDSERDRLTRVAKACLEAGVAERQVKLAELYGSTIADLLRAIFQDAELRLTPTQRRTLPTLLRRHLLAVEGTRSLTGDPGENGG